MNAPSQKQIDYICDLFRTAYPQPASEQIREVMPDAETLGEYLARVWEPGRCNRQQASSLISHLRSLSPERRRASRSSRSGRREPRR